MRPGISGGFFGIDQFQSTHPHGVRRLHPQGRGGWRVSIHAPTWGATPTSPRTGRMASFNPRTHMGCDLLLLTRIKSRKVSIHAPTWGATKRVERINTLTDVSIHAPTWGATRKWSPGITGLQSFNPRTHMGCDRCLCQHSPSVLMFQSTHPHGVRPIQLSNLFTYLRFQSTHPHGVRQNKNHRLTQENGFNPRTHMGCDTADSAYESCWFVSIHAPTWGATRFS